MRWILFPLLVGCSTPLLCDAEAPLDTTLEVFRGGGMLESWQYFASPDGVRDGLMITGDCRARVTEIRYETSAPTVRWFDSTLTPEEAADIAVQLRLGRWPSDRNDAIPDGGATVFTFGDDSFTCYQCLRDVALLEAFSEVREERRTAGTEVTAVGATIRAFELKNSGYAAPDPEIPRVQWTLDRAPSAFVTPDLLTSVDAEPEEVDFFLDLLADAATNLDRNAWALLTEVEGVLYGFYIRPVPPPPLAGATR